jgi:phosphate transport system substrate-binding protein
VYEQFVAQGYPGVMRFDESEIGNAFQLFCDTTRYDMVGSIRPMTQPELQRCLDQGRSPVVIRVGIDALAVVVHPANTFATSVTMAELVTLFTARRWSEVNPAWPDENIVRYLPPAAADTTTIFANKVLGGDTRLLVTAPDTTFAGDANELLQGVTDHPYAVGFLSYVQYHANPSTAKVLLINGIGVETDAVSQGADPLAYPLLIYTAPQILRAKPVVGDFLAFYLTVANRLVGQNGQFPLGDILLEHSKVNLLVAMDNQAYLQELVARSSTPTPTSVLTPTSTLTSTLISAPVGTLTGTLTSTLASTPTLTATITVTVTQTVTPTQ